MGNIFGREEMAESTTMNDKDRLEMFVRRAEEILDRRIVRNNQLNAFFDLSWDASGMGTYTINKPDEEDLRSYLVLFRQFVSPKEAVHLNRIYNICQMRLTSDMIRSQVAEAREDWKRSQQGNGVQVTIDHKRMTPEHVLDMMINGATFHSTDLDLQRELDALDPAGNLLTKWVYLNFLVDGTRQVLYLARTIKIAMRDGHFDFS